MNDMHNLDDIKSWECGELGATEEFVKKVSNQKEHGIDDNLGLQAISIRLQKELVERLKEIAKKEGLGYQPYIRQILTKYVNECTEEIQHRDIFK